LEIVDLFIFRRFSSRYDTDSFAAFRLSHNDNLTFQDANNDKPGFAVVETLIKDDNNIAIEHFWDIDEIYAMLFDIDLAFLLIPFVTHIFIVCTNCSYVNRLRRKNRPNISKGLLYFLTKRPMAGDIVPAAQRSGTSSPSGESPGLVCRENSARSLRETPLHAASRRLEGHGLAQETDKTLNHEKASLAVRIQPPVPLARIVGTPLTLRPSCL
jgi:hypothetical protein